jgi:WD40 repeat protein
MKTFLVSQKQLVSGFVGVLLLLCGSCPGNALAKDSPEKARLLPEKIGFPAGCNIEVNRTLPKFVLNRGHGGMISRIEINSDGSLVLTSGNNSARLWNVASKTLVHSLTGETRDANLSDYNLSATFQADGKSIIAGNGVGLQGWTIGTQLPCYSAELAGKRVDQVAASSSGTAVVAVRDGFTEDATSTLLIQSPSARYLTPFTIPEVDVAEAVSISDNGRFVAVGGHGRTGHQAQTTEAGKIVVWDVEKQVKVASLKFHPGALKKIRFDISGKVLFALIDDTLVRIEISNGSTKRLPFTRISDFAFLARTGVLAMLKNMDGDTQIFLVTVDSTSAPSLLHMPKGSSSPSAIAASEDGNHLGIAFREGEIGVFNLKDQEFSAFWKPSEIGITGTLELSRNANSAGRWAQGEIYHLDLRTGVERKIASLPTFEGFSANYDDGIFGEEQQFEQLTGISPNGEVIASGVIWSGLASLWDTRTGKKLRDLPYRIPGMKGLAFADGAPLMYRHDWNDIDDDNVAIENIKSGKTSSNSYVLKHQSQILFLRPFADGRGVAAGLYDGTVAISDPRHPAAGIGRINNDDFIVGLDVDKQANLIAVGYRSRGKHRVDLISLSNGERRSIELGAPVASIEQIRMFPSGHFVAITGSSAIILVSTDSLKTVAVLPLIARPDGLQVSSDSRLLAVSADGFITFFDVENPKKSREIITFTHLIGAKPLAISPDGFFDVTDLRNLANFSWIMPDDPTRPISGEIYMRDYFEPQLMARLLACQETRVLADDFCREAPSTLRPLMALNRIRPHVKILDVKPGRGPDQAVVTIEIRGASDPSQRNKKTETAAYDLRVFRNGQLVSRRPGGQEISDGTLDLSGWRNANLVEREIQHISVQMPSGDGEVTFSAYAFNEDRVKSETDTQSYSRPVPTQVVRRRAYVIAMGVDTYAGDGSRNLSYAAKDARDLSKALTGLPGYDVVPITLLSQAGQKSQGTFVNLQSVLEVLAGNPSAGERLVGVANSSDLAAALPDDLVIFTYSGHGLTTADGEFHLLPSDADPTGASSSGNLATMISSRKLAEWFEKIDAGQFALIIDACHSAAGVESPGFKPGPMGEAGFGQLAYDKGMRILVASQADNIALEVGEARQGLLTYSLLEGLLPRQGKLLADGNGDGLHLSEWLSYGERRTPNLYQDALDGKLQMISRNSGPDPSFSEAVARRAQTPRLFDFGRPFADPLIRQNNPH